VIKSVQTKVDILKLQWILKIEIKLKLKIYY